MAVGYQASALSGVSPPHDSAHYTGHDCSAASFVAGATRCSLYDAAFHIALPDTTSGVCATGEVPVYRLWNGRADSNHRYTTSTAIKSLMLANGYIAEGYGPDQVAMCAAQ